MVTAILRLCWISQVVTFGLTEIIFSTASMYVTVTVVAGVPYQCSSVKLSLPASSKFTKHEKDLGSGWSFLAKIVASDSQGTSLDVGLSYSHRISQPCNHILRPPSFKRKVRESSCLWKLFISEQIVQQKWKFRHLIATSCSTFTVVFNGVTSKGSSYPVTSGASCVVVHAILLWNTDSSQFYCEMQPAST